MYRICPPHRRTGQTMGTFTEKRWIARHRLSPFAHIRAYAIRPYSFWRKTYTKRHHPSPHPQQINGKYVGAYRIRPPHRRTCQAMGTFTEKRKYARRHLPRSPTSGRMRYAPTVFGEILTRNDAIHHRTPNKSMVNMLGRIAYALHMSGHARRWNC